MRAAAIIAGREIVGFLETPMASFVMAIFMLLSGLGFSLYLLGTNYADSSIRGFLSAAPYLVMLFAVLLSMRLIAEERKLGTWEFLMTAPVSEVSIILGKYVGSLLVFGLLLVATLIFPALLFVFGDPDFGSIAAAYVGLLLLGGAALAIGLFASSLASNQLMAAATSAGLLFALWYLELAAAFLPQPFSEAVAWASLSHHMPFFLRGAVDSRDVVYYLSIAAVFLFLAIRRAEADRWR